MEFTVPEYLHVEDPGFVIQIVSFGNKFPVFVSGYVVPDILIDVVPAGTVTPIPETKENLELLRVAYELVNGISAKVDFAKNE